MKKKPPIIKVEAPLSESELKVKVKRLVSQGKYALPKDVSLPSRDDRTTNLAKPEFTQVRIVGTGSWEDTIFVDGSGKTFTHPGGMSMDFAWGAKNIGFGRFRLTLKTNGKIEIDTEYMGKEFFRKFMNALIDQATDERDAKSAKKKAEKKPN